MHHSTQLKLKSALADKDMLMLVKEKLSAEMDQMEKDRADACAKVSRRVP